MNIVNLEKPSASNRVSRFLTIGLAASLIVLSFEMGRSIVYAQTAVPAQVPVPVTEILQSFMQSTVAIISALSALTIAVGKWLDSLRQKGILNQRWDKFIELQHKVAASLEQTDRAFAESEALRTSMIKTMAKFPTIKDFVESKEGQESISNIIKFEQETQADIKSYYETFTKTGGSESKDNVIKELSNVESKFVPATDGVTVGTTR
jgi:hypothetical protein